MSQFELESHETPAKSRVVARHPVSIRLIISSGGSTLYYCNPSKEFVKRFAPLTELELHKLQSKIVETRSETSSSIEDNQHVGRSLARDPVTGTVSEAEVTHAAAERLVSMSQKKVYFTNLIMLSTC